jgi:hypothetical protein
LVERSTQLLRELEESGSTAPLLPSAGIAKRWLPAWSEDNEAILAKAAELAT